MNVNFNTVNCPSCGKPRNLRGGHPACSQILQQQNAEMHAKKEASHAAKLKRLGANYTKGSFVPGVQT